MSNHFITRGMHIRETPILIGITALYMMPLITNDPALAGILFSSLKYFIIFSGFLVWFITKNVPAKNDHDRARWVMMPTFPYSFSLSIVLNIIIVNSIVIITEVYIKTNLISIYHLYLINLSQSTYWSYGLKSQEKNCHCQGIYSEKVVQRGSRRIISPHV